MSWYHLKVKFKSSPALGLGVLAVGIGFFIYAVSQNHTSRIPTSSKLDLKQERNFYQNLIGSVGLNEAYQRFKQNYQSRIFSQQHGGAHLIGELLYKNGGIGAVGVCDETFAYGCYHSFFTEALTDKGEAVIPLLNQSCLDRFGTLGTGCLHGIGHGIIEYMGPDKLESALSLCSKTTQINPLFGCTTGVMMEYFLPNNFGNSREGMLSPQVNLSQPYLPCPSLSAKFQLTCYYSLPQFWNRAVSSNYPQIGQWCHQISATEHQKYCFIGVGNIIATSSEYDPQATKQRCGQMGFSEGIIDCLAGAAWSFAATPAKSSLAVSLCQDLSEIDKSSCRSRSDLISQKDSSSTN